MAGYLLDNNVVSGLAWREPVVVAHFKAIGDAPVYLPVMAIAEIEEGLLRVDNPNEKQQKQHSQLREFLRGFNVFPFCEDTIPYYSLVRAEVFRLYGTKRKRGYTENTADQLKDRVTGRELGIDDRDLIIASIAMEHNLILATNDRNSGMKAIESAAQSLVQKGERDCALIVADWSIPLASCDEGGS